MHFGIFLGVGFGVGVDTGVEVGTKLALTDVAAFTVTVQADSPEQAPDQPAKVAPGHGVSVSVTVVPGGKAALHRPGQAIPDGALVISPVAAPRSLADTVSVGSVVPPRS